MSPIRLKIAVDEGLLTKKEIVIDISPLVSVRALKKKLSLQIGVPIEKFSLTYKGEQMSDINSVKSFHFPKEALLQCKLYETKRYPGMKAKPIEQTVEAPQELSQEAATQEAEKPQEETTSEESKTSKTSTTSTSSTTSTTSTTPRVTDETDKTKKKWAIVKQKPK